MAGLSSPAGTMPRLPTWSPPPLPAWQGPSIWSAGPSTIPSSVPTVGNPDIARLVQSRVTGQAPGLSAAQWQPIASQAEAAAVRSAQALPGALNPNLASLPYNPLPSWTPPTAAPDATTSWASQNGLNWSQLRPSASTSTPGLTTGFTNPYADVAGVQAAAMPPASGSGFYNFPGSAAASAGESPGFLQGLKSNALLRNTAPDAMAEGMGAAPALTGAARAKSYAGMAGKGLARGFGGMAIIGTANQLADALPANSAARPGIRSVGNVAGAGMMLPFIGGAQTAGAAPLGVGAAEIFSRTAAGNEIINASRNASTNPLANFAVNLNPILGGEQAIRKLADLMGGGDGGIDLSNRTNDTVFDIFGGERGGAQAVTPEQQQQRIAQTSPDALVKVTTDYDLDPAMAARLVENYRKSVVLTTAQGGVPLETTADGKLADGSLASDKPNVRKVTDAKGKTTYISSDPADIQEAVYTRSLQEIPLLAQQQSQEEDYMRKQALMQAQLEEAIPQYFGGASWAADPTAQMLAAASIRDIPSRYVQAQSMQTQQGINSQIQQAQIQQMLAQQYPELFGRQSSSQPATLDAAMAQ